MGVEPASPIADIQHVNEQLSDANRIPPKPPLRLKANIEQNVGCYRSAAGLSISVACMSIPTKRPDAGRR